MTTQKQFDKFQEDNADILSQMDSEVKNLFSEQVIELEELGLDEDNSIQLIRDIFEDI